MFGGPPSMPTPKRGDRKQWLKVMVNDIVVGWSHSCSLHWQAGESGLHVPFNNW